MDIIRLTGLVLPSTCFPEREISSSLPVKENCADVKSRVLFLWPPLQLASGRKAWCRLKRRVWMAGCVFLWNRFINRLQKSPPSKTAPIKFLDNKTERTLIVLDGARLIQDQTFQWNKLRTAVWTYWARIIHPCRYRYGLRVYDNQTRTNTQVEEEKSSLYWCSLGTSYGRELIHYTWSTCFALIGPVETWPFNADKKSVFHRRPKSVGEHGLSPAVFSKHKCDVLSSITRSILLRQERCDPASSFDGSMLDSVSRHWLRWIWRSVIPALEQWTHC